MKKKIFFKGKYALRNNFINNGYDMKYEGNKVIFTKGTKVLKQTKISKYGYTQVWLGGNIKKEVYVHRLAYELQKGKIKDGYEIDHIDNDVTNNSIKNLRMITKSENTSKSMQRSLANNKFTREKQMKAVVVWDDLNKDKPLLFKSLGDAAKHLGVAHSTVCDNVKGRTKLISKRYWVSYKQGDN